MQNLAITRTVYGINVSALVGLAVSVVMVLLLHYIAFFFARRVSRRTRSSIDDEMILAVYQPSRWLLVLLVAVAGVQALGLRGVPEKWWSIGSAMAMAGLAGWLALSALAAVRRIVEAYNDINVEDNLRARRRTTRVRILNRIAQVMIIFLIISSILLAIPSVRAVGVTLVASAGLAALAVGAAAQPALKNLIGGIQMAFTEPIRLDDVVIVEGEWGRIEDIRLTYVVVRIWDDRRLVVPVSYFLERPFQNWTREKSDLLGTVFLYVDHAADIERIRTAFIDAIKGNTRWDGRVALMQVTDYRGDAIELRGLLSARNAGVAWDLRCEVREAMVDFLRDSYPAALVRGRVRFDPMPSATGRTTQPEGTL
jgi:small-conductance mechanosensitive channel